MLAHSAALGLGESLTHQSALAALATISAATESSLKRSIFPSSCASEMHQRAPLHLSPHPSHGFSISHYQNNNNSPQPRATDR